MDKGIYTSLTGKIIQAKRFALLSNNLANVSTAGYKADQAAFEVAETSRPTSAPDPVRDGKGPIVPSYHCSMAIVSEQRTDFRQGPLKVTDNPFDVALSGDGFFTIEGPAGELYTRNGSFQLNSAGELVTSDGMKVLGSRGPITLDEEGPMYIGKDGEVIQGDTEVDRLKIVSFPRPERAVKVGNNLYDFRGGGTVEEATEFQVHQGYLEGANVNLVRSLADLVAISRRYETYQKVISMMSEADSKLVNQLGQVS